jgi:tRNA pseudouridine38-40 synthase
MAKNLKLTLSYDGAAFRGWQVQPNLQTVQGAIAAAINAVTGEDILPQGSGRTDAGVHALAQVASFRLASPIPVENLVKAMNDTLPASIRVASAEVVPPEFHARHSAQAKTYRYRTYRGAICPPFLVRYVYHHPFPLDEADMSAVAAEVIGEHDFTSFAAADPDRTERSSEELRSNVRKIYASAFRREGDELIYEVRGNGFLHHMVRNLMGTFLLAGKGTLKPADIREILAAKDRSANPGATAPPEGLYLVSVEY